jgi:hypothetical protein
MGDRSDARPLPTQDNTNTEKLRQASMPRVRSEPMIPVLERPKTVRASDHGTNWTGYLNNLYTQNKKLLSYIYWNSILFVTCSPVSVALPDVLHVN